MHISLSRIIVCLACAFGLLKISTLVSGCSHLPESVAVGSVIGELSPTPADSEDGDEPVDFTSLVWARGGFNGEHAALDSPRISGLRVHSNGLSFTYDTDLSSWGYAHTDHLGALACLFTRHNGRWEGGKFDWISSSRITRDFHNIRVDHYFGWRPEHLDSAEAVAFVIVSSDGRRRSNIIIQEVAQ
jgi:hypothetical protein